MRKFLMILIVAGLAGGCLGWFMDWYRIGVSATAEGHQLISIDINTQGQTAIVTAAAQSTTGLAGQPDRPTLRAANAGRELS